MLTTNNSVNKLFCYDMISYSQRNRFRRLRLFQSFQVVFFRFFLKVQFIIALTIRSYRKKFTLIGLYEFDEISTMSSQQLCTYMIPHSKSLTLCLQVPIYAYIYTFVIDCMMYSATGQVVNTVQYHSQNS